MVKIRPLTELSSRLRSLGYSRSFVNKIVGEFEDHFVCMVEENDWLNLTTAAQEREFEQRIGSPNELLDAITCRPELDPLPRKFPAIFYLLLPAAAVLAVSIGMLHLVFALRDNVIQLPENWSNVHYWGMYAALVIVPALGTAASIRYGVSLLYQFFLVLIVSLSTLFSCGVANCNQSGGAFYFAVWQFDPLKFFLPFAVTLIVLGVALSFAGGLRQNLLGRQQFPGIGPLILSAAAVGLFGLVFISGVNRASEKYRKHPVDNLIESGQSTSDNFVVYMLGTSKLRAELRLSDEQTGRIEQVLQSHWRQLDAYRKKNAEKKSDQTVFLESPLTPTVVQLKRLLNPDQKKRLDQLVLQALGWQSIFVPEVREELDLSISQVWLAKDALLESIHRRNALHRSWRDAKELSNEMKIEQMRKLQHDIEAEFSKILSDDQLNKIKQIQGPKIDDKK